MPRCEIPACDGWGVADCAECGTLICAAHRWTGAYHVVACAACATADRAQETRSNVGLATWGMVLLGIGALVGGTGFVAGNVILMVLGGVVGIAGLVCGALLFMSLTV